MTIIEFFDLQDELQALQDIDSYEIPEEQEFSPEVAELLLEAAVENVAESSSSITNDETFDSYRSLLKHADQVPGQIMSKLLDSISSGLQAEMEATLRDIEGGDQPTYASHKMPLEMYAFLLNWFVSAAERVKAPEDGELPAPVVKGRKKTTKAASKKAVDAAWTWRDQITPTLKLICRFLHGVQTQRIWTTTAERDAFINAITRPAHHVAENEAWMKLQEIKMPVFKVICLSVKHHAQANAVHTAIIQNIQFWEHLAEPMAELLAILSNEYDYPQLGDEVLREIAGMNFGGQDTKGPRNYARFLIKYGESCPRLVMKQLSLLLSQLDSESYPVRQALVEIIGFLIVELATAEQQDGDAKQTQKQINNFFNLLLDRVLDNSGYVRTRVFVVLAKLCDVKNHKFPKQRLVITSAAIEALDDKIASVRKAAIALLSRLLETHPYLHTHDGYLQKEAYQKDYNEVSEELGKIENAMGNAVKTIEAQNEKRGAGDENGDEGDDEDEVEGSLPKKSKKGQADEDEDEDEEGDDSIMDIDKDAGGDTEEDESDKMSVDEDEEGGTATKKKSKVSKLKPRKSQLNVEALAEEQAILAKYSEQEITRMRLNKKYFSDALNFIDQIEGAMDTMCKLLGSTSKAEVLEVMDFLRTAYVLKFDSATDGVKKMLHLIWNKDNSSTSEDGKELKGIRQRLLECYRGLYFDAVDDENMTAKDQVNRIAKNLIEQTYDATLAELTSLEEMMRIMMDEQAIHRDVINKLWQVYSKEKHLPKPQRRGAIIILGMLALSDVGVIADKVDVMLKVGLGPLGKSDPTLARYTCIALQRLNGSAKKVKGSLDDKVKRIAMDSPIFRKLQNAILHPSRTKEWFGMAEQVINTVYALAEHPDVFCNEVIKKLTVRAFTPKQRTADDQEGSAEKEKEASNEENAGDVTIDSADVTMQDATQATQSTQDEPNKEKDVGEAFEMSQLLFVVGHVAIKHVVYLELVEREWKRQKDEKQAAEKAASGNTRASKEGEELDQVAGNAEDEIGERIQAVRETELLYGAESLLAMYGPAIVHICGSPHKFKNRTLRAAATLSFSKFLCVSSQFCDQHHRLLFKILETSKDPNIRSNIVIALGDVAVSFSNIIDENSNELYKGLSDKNFVVKKNTLMVLTHLILNGMIKVKGQLGEMAKCLEDPEPRISDLAKLFFKELSTKDNAIYNNLPDVISHLSTGDHAVEEEVFQSTLRYIFTFIEKEKQAESIVEKLCQRFRLTEEPRQWRDVAYCLSLLPFKSERSVKKLIEGLQFYRDKLHEPVVFDRFTEILAKARTNKSKDKPDSDLNEFEKILEQHKAQGQEDQALEKRVEGKKAAAKKRAAKRSTRAKKPAPPPEDDMYSE